MFLFINPGGWGLIDDESFACVENEWMCTSQMDSSHSLRDYRKWERDFLVRDNIIRYKDLQKDPENYLFRSDFFELKELIDIKPEDAVYIKSSTEPFDEQMEINERKVKNWLDSFGIHYVDRGLPCIWTRQRPGASGMIQEIQPESLPHPY